MLLFFIQHIHPNSFIDICMLEIYSSDFMCLSKYMQELSSVLNLSTHSGHAVGVKAVTLLSVSPT